MYGCVLYLNHILDPQGRQPQNPEVTEAIKEILENVQEVPEGHGLELGHHWALFMVGISVFDDDKEALLRRKLKSDPEKSIYVSISWLKKDICLTGFYSILIALSNFSKFIGADNINTNASTIGEKYRFKWAFRCRSFAPSAL